MYDLFQKIRVFGIVLFAGAVLAGCTTPSLQDAMERTPMMVRVSDGYPTNLHVNLHKAAVTYCHGVTGRLMPSDGELFERTAVSMIASFLGGMAGAGGYNAIASASLPVAATGVYVAAPTAAVAGVSHAYYLRDVFYYKVEGCVVNITANDLLTFAMNDVEHGIGLDDYEKLIAAIEASKTSSGSGADTKVSPFGAGNPPARPIH